MTPPLHQLETGLRQSGTGLPPLLGLLAIALISTLAITVVANYTRDQIAANEVRRTSQLLTSVLPANRYDNEPQQDPAFFTAPELLGTNEPAPVYLARNGNKVVALAITTIAADGYVGPIKVLIGIDVAGEILTVRVIEHRETPGLGDQIEIEKSDWIELFTGKRLANQTAGELLLKKDGGDIDHITGATITSRAVASAVARGLEFYANNRTLLNAELPQQP